MVHEHVVLADHVEHRCAAESRSSGGLADVNGGSRSSGMSSVASDMRSPRSRSEPGVLHVVLGQRRQLGRLLVAQFFEQQRAQMLPASCPAPRAARLR